MITPDTTTPDTSTRLRDFIRAQFNIKGNDPDFTDHVHLFDYGYIDSFGAVTLTSFVERTFNVKVTESDLIAYPMNTIDEISTFIVRRQKGEI